MRLMNLRARPRAMPAAGRRQYDHRIRKAIVKTGNPDLFPKIRIPDSTLLAPPRRRERRPASRGELGSSPQVDACTEPDLFPRPPLAWGPW